jgi:sensor histidine kinase YesM
MKEFALYVLALLMAALMFSLLFLALRGVTFEKVFFAALIFCFSVGFIIKILSTLFLSRQKKQEIHIRILSSIPIFFIGAFIGLIIANRVCYLLFGTYPFAFGAFTPSILMQYSLAATLLFLMLVGSTMFVERTVELRKEAEISKLEASLKILQAQINPHFLFNSLASIQSLIQENPRKAEKTLTSVSEMFRYSLRRWKKDLIKLTEEIDFIKRYLFIEEMRLGNKLDVIWDVDEGLLNCLIPPFLIQPIVENAVKYGIMEQGEGKIKISLKEKDGKLNISVSDTGSARINLIPEHSLYNIKKRIEVLYGTEGFFKVRSNGEVEIEISIPKEYSKSNKEDNGEF